MKTTSKIEIETTVNKESLSALTSTVVEEFKKVSKLTLVKDKETIIAKRINPNFISSDFRKDSTTINIKVDENNKGYVIRCDTNYRKSIWFYLDAYFLLFFLPFNFSAIFTWEYIGALCFYISLSYFFYFHGESKLKQTIDVTLNNIQNGFSEQAKLNDDFKNKSSIEKKSNSIVRNLGTRLLQKIKAEKKQ
jgi:hypothetical protein